MQVALYKGRKRLFNRITAWWLKGPYSHCELVLGTNHIGQAICASSSFMDGGVRIKHMLLDPAHWDLVDVGDDEAQRAQAWAWLALHRSERYDLLGLLGFVARVLGHDQARWTCSEAVAAMLCIPDPWRFDPCVLGAALAAQARHLPISNPQPASAGFLLPDEAGGNA